MLLFVVLLQVKRCWRLKWAKILQRRRARSGRAESGEATLRLVQNPELNVKPKELEQRGGGAYYSDAACEVINAIYNDKQTEHYVNIPHHGHVREYPGGLGGGNDLHSGTQWRDAAPAYHPF